MILVPVSKTLWTFGVEQLSIPMVLNQHQTMTSQFSLDLDWHHSSLPESTSWLTVATGVLIRLCCVMCQGEMTDPTLQRQLGKVISKKRWMVEASFGRRKNFHILTDGFRHDMSKLRPIWLLITGMYNLDLHWHPLTKNEGRQEEHGLDSDDEAG
eukprot:TRINITY_DN65295_c1_g2_i3.p1 TRINITY_DN65295_c1_g2~~TRINITY_DN65295_c1_g2_i3.p1  ORF type:complete len:155 (-),score=14.49 TRINITY_DN65295_c1_g2_i3:247-711(-)